MNGYCSMRPSANATSSRGLASQNGMPLKCTTYSNERRGLGVDQLRIALGVLRVAMMPGVVAAVVS